MTTLDTPTIPTASHVRTVSRHLAHRCAVSEVFVTSLQGTGDDFVAGAQLPRMHAFYGDHLPPYDAEYDPMLVMEAARQASIALSHEFLGVPHDFGFVVRTFNGAVTGSDSWRIGSAPADLVMSVQISRRHTRGGTLVGVDMVLEIECDGAPMMIVDGSFTWVPPARWDALRSGYRTGLGLGEIGATVLPEETAATADVSRANSRNVVIGPVRRVDAAGVAELRVDTGHPILFDHPLDHVPGSLLLEAARQGATAMSATPAPRLIGVSSSFDRFVELDCRTECVVRISETMPGEIDCEIHQCGAVAARIGLRYETDAVEC
ncbi:ScbA/BarX family gamma-butyrolactone biosynthesis protein [Nocardia vermiculata]|uniref:Gamma-butyrolactone biosynthesis protein n=1 Tax=Nocardia vermiculata TaxID=257274 RepID=A0A846XUJ7_9NOCA|nr:ScbA/BarX family gamma-butyrolactone biosynthesis protein [Nocardia vermiculata]NKY49245.1 gamma-butyrolactone biosynthesis protein [Nocardia vermiculata]